MMVKHRIRCFDSDVLVCEASRSSFRVNIQGRSNPLGFGRTLAAFDDFESALEAAERFCLAYRIAREHGYYLKENELIKHDRAPISVEWAMNGRLSGEEWMELLSGGADVG